MYSACRTETQKARVRRPFAPLHDMNLAQQVGLDGRSRHRDPLIRPPQVVVGARPDAPWFQGVPASLLRPDQ